ncbi:hypothetical protein QIA31_04855 (plasmid) [Borreliella turdi]|uniref:hypothetical protein n=1 Tax=Borreliella turdi TaxID=57863 RepID=UPI003AF0829C
MKIKNIYLKVAFLILLIFISACSQDGHSKKDKVLSYSEEDNGPHLHPAVRIAVDFHSGSLFLNSIKASQEALYRSGLLKSTNLLNYEKIESLREKNGMPPMPPAHIYYADSPTESTFFTIGVATPHVGGPHLGRLEIVVRADDLVPQGFLVHRAKHHDRRNLNKRYYRFFGSTIKNIYRAETSSIKLKDLSGDLDSNSKEFRTTLHDRGKITKLVNIILDALQHEPEDASQLTSYFSEAVSAVLFLSLAPLLDYRIQGAVLNLVRTDHFSSSLTISDYLHMIRQWGTINYLQYIAMYPSKDVRHGKPSITPEAPLVYMNIIRK